MFTQAVSSPGHPPSCAPSLLSSQLGRYTKEGQLFLGPLGSTGEDTRCVVDDQVSRFPQLVNCEKVTSVKQKTWHFSQVRNKRLWLVGYFFVVTM